MERKHRNVQKQICEETSYETHSSSGSDFLGKDLNLLVSGILFPSVNAICLNHFRGIIGYCKFILDCK